MPLTHNTTEDEPKPPRWELADIFRLFGQDYRNTHPLPLSHLKVMHAIEICRTAYLGGHLYECDSCEYELPVYNSCGNRHCPKCQTLAKVYWLAKRKAELLPVGYFHNVFTLPHELNLLALRNKKVIYDLLFKSTAETLLAFGTNPENGLGGNIGFTALLHTWDQKLLEHIHLHCIIPAGALSFDKKHWIPCPHEKFLFPIRALSKVFRGKFINYLEQAFDEGQLIFPGKASQFETKKGFHTLIQQLWKKDWVVYSKEPLAGPHQVLDYLARYTHRIAISNDRIKKVENGEVSFTWRDRNDNNRIKKETLPAHEFIRRFLLHVLPDSYMRIRHFGFLSNRHRKQNLSICRELLGLDPHIPEVKKQSALELLFQLTGKDFSKCPRCKTGTLVFRQLIPKEKNYFYQPETFDSS